MEHQSYYAVIPANVRYDSKIPMGAKLLYGEITCLCNKEGFCWATNAYFSKLYSVSDRSIQRWLECLREKEYIDIKVERGASIEQTKRHITIKCSDCREDMTKMSPPHDKNVTPPHDKNVAHNNTSINNKKNTSLLDGYSPMFVEVFNAFVENRKTLKKPMTDYAKKLMLNKLKKLADAESEQIAILNQSIERGWIGVFPLKEEAKSKTDGDKSNATFIMGGL